MLKVTRGLGPGRVIFACLEVLLKPDFMRHDCYPLCVLYVGYRPLQMPCLLLPFLLSLSIYSVNGLTVFVCMNVFLSENLSSRTELLWGYWSSRSMSRIIVDIGLPNCKWHIIPSYRLTRSAKVSRHQTISCPRSSLISVGQHIPAPYL